MNIIQIITKKKNNEILTYDEIKYTIDNFLNGEIKDYQMSSLLMAIVINGMNIEETLALTDCMLKSGNIIDLSEIKGTIVDKHSTGGVGDKVTLILAPLVASANINFAKMSGRGLGHTGGTIDKLESISNFKVKLDKDKFINQINKIGVSIISQTENIVPADKSIYALRDVTGTTESIPLIASSIMSKKIASGATFIIIDIKVGNGALLKTEKEARQLAKLMIEIGKHYNKEVVCVLTNMSQPLGLAIGNGIEVKESIETLKGNGPSDLETLVITLATIILQKVNKISQEEAETLVINNLKNGKAYDKFLDLIKYQEGDINDIAISKNIISIKTSKDGFINKIDTLKLGEIVRSLGGGRLNKNDEIDYKVGIVVNKKVGSYVFENEELAKLYIGTKDISLSEIISCFEISDIKPEREPLIIDIISN